MSRIAGIVVERLWLMSIHASILIGIVLIVRLFLKNHKKMYSYLLWMLVLVRLLCPVMIESKWSMQPDFITENNTQMIVQNGQAEDTFNGQINVVSPENIEGDNISAITSIDNAKQSHIPYMGNSVDTIIEYLYVLYIIGVIGFGIYFIVQFVLIKKRVAFSIREISNIWLSEKISSPFVMGIVKPKIYLPYGILPEEKKYILRHERAHIAHNDPLVRFLGTIAIILHWWNPLAWLAIHKMNQDMEMFCDETALATAIPAEKKEYSQTLLHFAAKQSGLAVVLSFGESNTEVRIRNVLRKKRNSIFVAIVVGVIGILCVIVFMTTPQKDETDDTLNNIQAESQAMEEPEKIALEGNSTQQIETNMENEDENFYELTSTLSKSVIENYAKEVRNMILNHDWEKLSREIAYPVKIAGVEYSNAEEFLSSPLDSIVTEEFMQGVKNEDCNEMFHNWSGIMLGETGEVWLAEFLAEDLETHILQIIAINIAEPQQESVIEGLGTYATEPWYSAYRSILNDWTTIDQYGDFSYLKMYFDIDYQFDNYWLCDIDSNGIPELLLHSDYMGITAAFTYYKNQIHFLTYDVIWGINKETDEIVIEGHWHGAGGSGVDEWTAYQVKDNEVNYSMYIDFYREYEELGIEKPYVIYKPSTGEYERQESSEEYDQLYAIHVTPCVFYSKYQRYDLNDLNGLDVIQ